MESFFSVSIILLLLLLLFLFLWGFRRFQKILQDEAKRRCSDPDANRNKRVDKVIAPYIPDQLIVWRKHGVSETVFKQWKAELLDKLPGTTVRKICQYCDDSLELWEGDNVTTVVTEKTVGTSGGDGTDPSKVTGGGDVVASFSLNFVMDLPEPPPCVFKTERPLQPDPLPPLNGTPLIVAVFDTGLLDDLKNNDYTKQIPNNCCMPEGQTGWNFADKNKVTNDDHKHTHGSVVAAFIKEQEAIYRMQAINILPVKTHNCEGKGDLYSVLCGFAYAANCKAKIINASFGFYSAKHAEPPAILVEFVQRVLTNNNILLIAAAGNTNSNNTVGKSIFARATVRNLDKNPFFPACLSVKFPNVLTVTTVSPTTDTVSPSQNYSNTIVDIGVQCDNGDVNGDYGFTNPLHATASVVGSSYATPVVTGKIAQHYKKLTDDMSNGIDKDKLLSKMEELGLLSKNDQLEQYVKNGYWAKKKN